MRVHLTLRSKNTKTGPIPVSTSPRVSCPHACKLRKAKTPGGKPVCYAGGNDRSAGGKLGLHWNRVDDGTYGDAFPVFLEKIRALPDGQVWRHNQAGDLPGRGDRINRRELAKLAEANRGRRGFTYTHKPMEGEHGYHNRRAVRSARAAGFAINLSADDVRQVDSLSRYGIPVVTVLPAETSAPFTLTAEGRRIVTCPATLRADVTCKTCGNGRPLCGRLERDYAIGFPAHGAGAGSYFSAPREV